MLFLVESTQLLEPGRESRLSSMSFRGGMKWIRSGGHEYLVRLTDSKGNGKSLGRRDSKTDATYQAFIDGGASAVTRYESLSARIKEQAKLNMAVGLDRLPRAVANLRWRTPPGLNS